MKKFFIASIINIQRVRNRRCCPIKKWFFLFLCLLFLLSCLGCSEQNTAADKTILAYLAEEPKTLDPQIASDYSAAVIIEALFEGLVRLDEKNEPYSGIAETWESNADSTVFTFYLKKDAYWSAPTTENDEEADPVTAYDFVFAFRRAVSPETNAPHANLFFCIKNAEEIYNGNLPVSSLGVSAPTPSMLVVELNYSYPDFPSLTATTPFMPCNERFFAETVGKYGLEEKYILGNGPFRFSGSYAWEHGSYVNLSRSNSYAKRKEVLPSGVTFYLEDAVDVSNPIEALSSNTVHVLPISKELFEQAQDAKLSVSHFEDTVTGLIFNTSDSVMQHLGIRQAFLQSLDRDRLLENLPPHTRAASDIIFPEMTLLGQNYRLSVGSDFYLKHDTSALQKASSALDTLNLETIPSVSVLCLDHPSVKLLVNEMIVSWNKTMGNYFNMTPLSYEELSDRISSGNYQIALFSVRADSSNPVYLLKKFSSDKEDDSVSLKDPGLDEMLRTIYEKDNLFSACAEAERYLNEQGLFYPIYYENSYYATAKGVTGLVIHPYRAGLDFTSAGIIDD